MQEISGGSTGDYKIEDHEGRCLGLTVINSFPAILNYTTDFHFFPVRGGRLVDMQTFQISIHEVAEYSCFHLSPVY